MNIELTNLKKQGKRVNRDILKNLSDVIDRADFIQGKEVKILEQNLLEYSGSKHVITCGNGTDALHIALRSLEPERGDYVICPSFSFISTAEIIPLCGAIPFFVDSEENKFNMSIKSLINAIDLLLSSGKRIAAIISVDLFGMPSEYDQLLSISKEHNIKIIADCAQSFGAKYKGSSVLSIADISTTSFFPTKPLGCYGDGGAIFTNSDELAKSLRSIAIHGKGQNKYNNVRIGVNSRLDTLQAVVLIEKLKILEEELILRNEVAKLYDKKIDDKFIKPQISLEDKRLAWAQYTLLVPAQLNRELVIDAMSIRGISTGIFYPKPIHQQPAYLEFSGVACLNAEKFSLQCLSLPMGPYVTDEEIDFISDTLNNEVS